MKKNRNPIFIPNQEFYTSKSYSWRDNPKRIKEEDRNEEYRKKLALKSK